MIVQRYNESFRDKLYYGQSNYAACYEGSFLDYDWSDGDVVFANSTCFDDDLMDSLSQEAENLKPGAMVVTFTKGMTSDKFEVLERKRYKMSWGPATVFIHRRLNEDGTPVGPPKLNILPSDNITYDDDDNAAYNKAYGGGAAGANNDDDDDEDEEDDDEDEDDEEDDIDENERDVDEEDEEDEEEDDEDEGEEEEGEDEEDGEQDFDIDEYIRKITSEMKRKDYLSKTVDSEEDQDGNSEEDSEEAEEKAGDADDEEASAGEEEEEEDESPDEVGEEVASGEDDNDDDEDDEGESGDDGDDGSEDLNAVAAEMEEQIRQITERINYNKSLINSYTEKLNSPSRTTAGGGGAGSIESSSGSNSPAGLSGYSKESTSPASFQGAKNNSPPRTTPTKAAPNTQPIAVSSNGSGSASKSPVKSTAHLSIQSPSTRDYNAEFLAMTSPQDSALQARKRLASQNAAARKLQQPSFDDLSN